MKKREILFLTILLIASAMTLPSDLSALPEYKGFVTDHAGVIDADDRQVMEAVAEEIRKKSGAEIAVLTVKSIEPYATIEEFSVETAQQWGIGEKGKDNGVLIVLSTGERKVRIEVGYGLEGAIPDGRAGEIIDKYMIPYFRNNDFSSGLKTGLIAAAAVVAGEYNIELTGSEYTEAVNRIQSRSSGRDNPGAGIAQIIVLIIFLMSGGRIFWPLLFLSAASGRRRRYYGGGFGSGFRSGGGFSGGFGGFGGGSFGGGGASRGF